MAERNNHLIWTVSEESLLKWAPVSKTPQLSKTIVIVIIFCNKKSWEMNNHHNDVSELLNPVKWH